MIVLSKLQPPEIRTKTLQRPRLTGMISKNLDKKVMLMCAGPGYGKTTLLSHFLRRAKIPAVYYHLERSDAEPAVFFSYLIAGLQKMEPSFGRKVSQLRSLFNQPQRYSDIIIGTFINEVVELIKEDTFIILEDYHALQESSAIDRALDYLFQHMPANLHFIITSRTKPSIYFALMTARDEFLEIGTAQLRFTRAEIKALFRKTYSIPLKNEDLECIEKYSEGWPVSLRMMIQSPNYLEAIRASARTGSMISGDIPSRAGLFNYFAQEIFYREPRPMRRFLCDCSLFEWLDPALFDAATKRRGSEDHLAELARRNAFVVRIPEHGYRLHILFREFLNSKFTDARRRREVCLRAAEHLYRKGDRAYAFSFYAQASVYKQMARIIKEVGPVYTSQGKSSVVCSYVEQIPARVRNQDPGLLIAYAQALNIAGMLKESRTTLLRARRIVMARKGLRHMHADILYALGGNSFTEDNFAAAQRYYRHALRVCPPNADLTRASILNSLGSLDTARGGKYLAAAVRCYEQAFKIARNKDYGGIEASILNNWAISEWKRGDLNSAHAKLSGITDLLAQHFTPGCGAGFFNAAKLSLLLGSAAEAKQILDTGMKTCTPYNDTWSLVVLWTGYGLLHSDRDEFEKAKEYFDRSLQMALKLGVDRLTTVVLTEMCKINVTTGNLVAAEEALSQVWSVKKTRDDAESLPVHLAEARLRMAQGKLQEAERSLDRVRSLASRYGDTFNQFLAALESAKFFNAAADASKARDALQDALRLSREKGYDYLLSKELRAQPWLVQSIRENDIELEYVRSVIRGAKVGMYWIEASLFGVPRMCVDGQMIEEKDWPTVKTKKLFFFLLLHRSDKIESDRLIEALWPGSSQKKGGDSLRKAAQYIRKVSRLVLGQDAELVCVARGAYQLAPTVSAELDIDEFDALYKRAKASEDDEERARILQKAIALHRDDLASGWYDEWVEELRRHCDARKEECSVMLAETFFHQADFRESVRVCEALIAQNPLEEAYYRLLMQALARLGRYRKVDEVFETLRRRLRKGLKTRPRKETLDLYTTLMKGSTGQ